jgi:hypothetical protein
MKVRRFFWVSSRRCKTVHIQFGKHHSEGLTACGRRTVPRKWFWSRIRSKYEQVCAQCVKAAGPGILVARVRAR